MTNFKSYLELIWSYAKALNLVNYTNYRWVPLKPDFLGAGKSAWLKHYLAYPIIISLIIQRNLATKIWAKWESGLTTEWLKWDPPVQDSSDTSFLSSIAFMFESLCICFEINSDIFRPVELYIHSFLLFNTINPVLDAKDLLIMACVIYDREWSVEIVKGILILMGKNTDFHCFKSW